MTTITTSRNSNNNNRKKTIPYTIPLFSMRFATGHSALCFPLFFNTDSYTTEDIVFKWNTTNIRVGTKEMAQFEYKGAKLSSDIEVFAIGKHCYHFPSIVLNSLTPSAILPSL